MGALNYKTRRNRRHRLAAELYATWTPRRLFTFGTSVGWAHWYDDPNTLYRRRNRLTYSSQFSNAAWARTNILSVTDNADGVGDLVVPNTTNSTHILVQVACVVGASHVLVVRAKAGGYNHIAFTAGTPTGYANINAGTGGTVSGGATVSVSAASDAPGYYDCTFTFVATSANCTLYVANADGSPSYAGDGTSGIYLARAQLETYTTTASEYQDVPTTWEQAYLDAVGAERIFAWQDSAGTTPVTAVGQSVGLILDRAYGGRTDGSLIANGATGLTGTATAASYNTSTGAGSVSRAGDASNQSWVTWTGLTTSAIHRIRITNTGATSLDVRNGGVAGTIVASIAAGATSYVHPLTSGGSTSITITATANSTTATFTLSEFARVPGTHRIQASAPSRSLLMARVNLLLNSATMSTQNVTTLAASYLLRFEGTGTVTLSGTATAGPLSAGTHSVTATAGTLTLTVSGTVTNADFRTAGDAAKNIPSYQRVGATAADHDTAGFPHYLLYDGTDDSYASTATVDGSGSDKVTVVTGVTKNSDAAGGVIVELTADSNSNNGAFFISAPNSASANFGFKTRGTVAANASGYNAATYTAPTTRILSLVADLASSVKTGTVKPYIDGVLDQGEDDAATVNFGGNFANATLYFGSRAGSSARFIGRDYGGVARFGPMSETERNRLESWFKNWMRMP